MNIITDPPTIRPFNFEPDLLAQSDTQVQCYVSKGDLPVTIEWYFHGRPINSINGVRTVNLGSKSSILSIESLSITHSGEYTCVARNSAGEDEYSSTLTVHGSKLNLASIIFLYIRNLMEKAMATISLFIYFVVNPNYISINYNTLFLFLNI